MSSRHCTTSTPLNTDISGIGVRISFYLQTLFLGFLSARSGSIHEIAGALYTLMATNTAMSITGLILGLNPKPDIGFQDALVILYLLSMSWIVVNASLASCNRLSDDAKVLQGASVIQSYIILAFAFAVLATADRFGSNPECNKNIVAVFFFRFSALKVGRILGGIVLSLAATCYTAMTIRDYMKRLGKRKELWKNIEEPSPPAQSPPVATLPEEKKRAPVRVKVPTRRRSTNHGKPTRNIDNELLFTLAFILVVWALFVLNTELVIRWNQSAGQNGASSWQFGQILPMFLTLLPLVNVISAFSQFGIKPTKQVEREQLVKVSVIYDRELDNFTGR